MIEQGLNPEDLLGPHGSGIYLNFWTCPRVYSHSHVLVYRTI